MSSISLLPVFLIVFLLLIGDDLKVVGGFQHEASSKTMLKQESSSFLDTRRWTQSNDIQEQESTSASTGGFGFQAMTPKPIIPSTVQENSDEEVEARLQDEPMFTASTRRDLYNIMRNPFKPHIGAPAPLSWWGSTEDGGDEDHAVEYEESSQFGGILLGKRSSSSSSEVTTSNDIFFWDTYAFTDRMTYDPSTCEGFTVLDDNQVLSAIAILGSSSTAHSIALTKAFEAWLAELAASHWGDLEASRLSVEFLVAFGNELTERLGINHRILSTSLTHDEMEILSEPPFRSHVLPELLEDFQTSDIEVDEEQAEAAASTLWWDQDENSPEY
ncbi:unnamed protein product [Cylindrotheca closterium]|uniref:Phospholipase B-like n=1 Tax=Cylindrotheca closterium TaxID=2856 RepID=A0AAD2FEQ1_9STRA|nr:unnamed protein product [Cylindrotheca closterium]